MINIATLCTKTDQVDPTATALIDPAANQRRSFGDLSQRVDALAHLIRDSLHLRRGARVVVHSRNSIEFIEMYLACARAGTMLVPLNWRQPTALNADILNDIAPSALFYDREFSADLAELGPAVDGIPAFEWSTGEESSYEAAIAAELAHQDSWASLPDPDSLLQEPYLALSTGGTTGIPKSAVHTQQSFTAMTLNYIAAQRINETDVFMLLGQLFHVTGYMVLAHLAMGRPVVVTNFDAEIAVDIIQDQQVTSTFCVATMLPRLLSTVRNRGLRTPSLRLVGYGGAPMPAQYLREAAALLETELVQFWGMTEFGIGTVLTPRDHRLGMIHRPELLNSGGRAALLSEVAILGPDGVAIPKDGVSSGEICHRGPNTMWEYLGKEAETSAMFDHGGWLHSGDRGTWDADGYIHVVDRMKNMIISGGENIFPAEVERSIASLQGVAEVAVFGEADLKWGEVVRAAVVRVPGWEIDEAAVAAHVERELGSFRKPRIIDFVEALPMTATGKIDLAALRGNAS
jgi:acyl-CoA synthetase (AMP-forming)/AMP-acid ligase II